MIEPLFSIDDIFGAQLTGVGVPGIVIVVALGNHNRAGLGLTNQRNYIIQIPVLPLQRGISVHDVTGEGKQVCTDVTGELNHFQKLAINNRIKCIFSNVMDIGGIEHGKGVRTLQSHDLLSEVFPF